MKKKNLYEEHYTQTSTLIQGLKEGSFFWVLLAMEAAANPSAFSRDKAEEPPWTAAAPSSASLNVHRPRLNPGINEHGFLLELGTAPRSIAMGTLGAGSHRSPVMTLAADMWKTQRKMKRNAAVFIKEKPI